MAGGENFAGAAAAVGTIGAIGATAAADGLLARGAGANLAAKEHNPARVALCNLLGRQWQALSAAGKTHLFGLFTV